MKTIVSISALFVAAAVPARGFSQTSGLSPNPTTPQVEAADATRETVPLFQGAKAPFTGLLVPEERFVELIEAEINLEAAEQKLQVQLRFNDALETMYRTKLKEATAEQSWYETASFNRWVGFSIGIVVTGLVIWGGTEIVKAAGDGH